MISYIVMPGFDDFTVIRSITNLDRLHGHATVQAVSRRLSTAVA
jgi:hypothetical protein